MINAYLAHPVGSDPEERIRNLANVQKWFRWLIDNTDFTLNCPWFLYVSTLDESYRKRAMRDDLRILDTCNAIILTGGKITPGMAEELALAKLKAFPVYDLTGFGYEVPESLAQEQLQAVLDAV